MTTPDLHLFYKREKGVDAPQVGHPHYLPEVIDYINWLEENLIGMTTCVDDLTACIQKATEVMNRNNPLNG